MSKASLQSPHDRTAIVQRLGELRRQWMDQLGTLEQMLVELENGSPSSDSHSARLSGTVLIECGDALRQHYGWRSGQAVSELFTAEEWASVQSVAGHSCASNSTTRLIIRLTGPTEGSSETTHLLVLPLHKTSAHALEIASIARRTAHDFNNILTTILGYAELGTMMSAEPRLSSYFSEILQTSRRGQTLVKDLQEHLQQALPAPTTTGADSDRVLVVDDDTQVANALTAMLRRAGHQVCTAYSGEEALEQFSADPSCFDLLLADYNMPGINGVDLIARIARRRPDLPAVLCTGWGDTIDTRDLMGARVHSLVAKPVEEAKLLSVVRDLLSGEGAVRPRN